MRIRRRPSRRRKGKQCLNCISGVYYIEVGGGQGGTVNNEFVYIIMYICLKYM